MGEVISKSFEKRLKDQLEKKEQMLNDLKKKYDQQSNDGASTISNGIKSLVSKKLIQQIQSEFEERLKYYDEVKKKRLEDKLLMEQSKYQFTPRINENSRKLVGSRERLHLDKTPEEGT